MRIVLRADASPKIGFGHVSRCLALAEALVRNGHAVALLGAEPPAALRALAGKIGVEHLGVSAPDPCADLLASLDAIRRWGGADACVVDHHELGRSWEAAIREAGLSVVAIDDLGREHECDLLVDANAGVTADRYHGRVPPRTWLMLGPRYALLREGFREEHRHARVRRQAQRILVSYGGTDPTGETIKAIEALAPLGDLAVDVTVTSAQPQFEHVRALASTAPQLTLHVDRSDLEHLLADADLVLGAAGVSALERACLGVPSIATVVADNQTASGAALADAGAMMLLGEAASVTPARLRALVEGLRACPDAVARMSAHGLALVDGRGAIRVATALASLRFQLRRATLDDARAMFEWRDHPRTRQFSLDPGPLDWETHVRWLGDRLADANCDLLIGGDESGPIGVLRFDVDGTAAAVSLYLLPHRQGCGLGAPLLRAGERWLLQKRPQLTKLWATVREANAASLRVFLEAGYNGSRRDLHRTLSMIGSKGGST